MKTRTRRNLVSSPQRASLPQGKPVLSMLLALAAIAAAPGTARAQNSPKHGPTPITPIQHVIVVFGENRSFDHVFGTYVPKPGQTVWNLLSQGIVKPDGTPGPNFSKAHQNSASDTEVYTINPAIVGLYNPLPDPLAGGNELCGDKHGEPFCTLSVAETYETNMDPAFNQYLITGATGLPSKTPDTRITNYSMLLPGPFQLTNGTTMTYDDYAASPVHRFYQMWQQTDCSAANATHSNPSGCLGDLFPWVEVTIGAGSNGSPQSTSFNDLSTGEGSTAMVFYNMQAGDAPYLKSLADQYTISDNFHQGVMGGTGPNHIMLNYADAMWYSDGNGNPATPPYNQVENPNPEPGTNNWYVGDGYSGGTYTDCSDINEPGVAPIVNYLQSLPTPINPNCEPGHYYLLNNYNPGYNGDGSSALQYSQYTIPPTTQPHIGDILAAAGISYTFFGEDWNVYVTDPTGQNPLDEYCNICNGFQYAKDIMTSPAQRSAHIADMNTFFGEIASNSLPAVSIIQPSGFVDGHPASSKIDLWEGFLQNIITKVQANSELWQTTAIFMLFDEGGGYYDSGYIQPLDFFGDGTRMPLLIVSPFSTGGNVYHGYSDHASIPKFIERNWNLPTISYRSRDNLPNPTTAFGNPYIPINTPAIDDLFGAFTFPASSTTFRRK
jgi:phospholipase C